MLSMTHYAQNYAGIVGGCLTIAHGINAPSANALQADTLCHSSLIVSSPQLLIDHILTCSVIRSVHSPAQCQLLQLTAQNPCSMKQ